MSFEPLHPFPPPPPRQEIMEETTVFCRGKVYKIDWVDAMELDRILRNLHSIFRWRNKLRVRLLRPGQESPIVYAIKDKYTAIVEAELLNMHFINILPAELQSENRTMRDNREDWWITANLYHI